MLPNSVGAVVAFFALQAFGRVPAMLNFSTGTKNMIAALTAARIKTVLTSRRFVETARMTTHSDPVYTVENVIHYCVGNMPGAVARTATQALTNATLPWVLKLAEHGPDELACMDHNFANAVNINRGTLTNKPVAQAHDLTFEALPV